MDSVAEVLDVVGERWALLVVREVSIGLRRFDEIQAAIGAPRTVLAERLRRLTAAGILATRNYQVPGARARSEYTLTVKRSASKFSVDDPIGYNQSGPAAQFTSDGRHLAPSHQTPDRQNQRNPNHQSAR